MGFQVNDVMYTTLGALGFNGTLPERIYKHLGSLGHLQLSMSDRLGQFGGFRVYQLDILEQDIILGLFLGGEQGTWFDPSDLTTLFQDAAGTTPVTAVEQPVGLMLDKSGNGHHASQPTAASRPILSARVNRYVATSTLATQSITTLAATYTLSFSGTGTITLSGTATGVFSAGTYSVACTAGTLTSTVSGTVSNADIRVANEAVTAPAYQRVTTATDYDAVGFPYYLRFDGVDDWLSTASIDFTGTDKVSVFAGVRALSVGRGILVHNGDSTPAPGVDGRFSLEAPGFTGSNYVATISLEASNADALSSTLTPPSSDVLTARYDGNAATPSGAVKLRRNTTETTSGSGGVVNPQVFLNSAIYIGRQFGQTRPFNGNLYGLIIRGALTDDPTTSKVEKLLATKTGVQF